MRAVSIIIRFVQLLFNKGNKYLTPSHGLSRNRIRHSPTADAIK